LNVGPAETVTRRSSDTLSVSFDAMTSNASASLPVGLSASTETKTDRVAPLSIEREDGESVP